MTASGPLAGITILELAGLGPAPYAATVLAEFGANVIRVDRPGGIGLKVSAHDALNRSRQNVILNLQHEQAAAIYLELVQGCDVVIDPYRPGVADRLGIGPQACHEVNPGLVYAQMTGVGPNGATGATGRS